MQEPRSDEAEQQYVSRLYARVDQLRAEKVEQLRQIQSTGAILSLIHISEPTRRHHVSRMPSSA